MQKKGYDTVDSNQATCVKHAWELPGPSTKSRGFEMWKHVILGSFFLVMFNGPSLAEIYKCEDAQGITVYTDDSSKIPRDCVKEQIVELPQLNVIPAQPSPPGEQSIKEPPLVPATHPASHDHGDRSYSYLKNEAVSLVEAFDSARKNSYHSSLLKNKQKARQTLSEIRSQKSSLLIKVESSPLTKSQKKEISELLSSITD